MRRARGHPVEPVWSATLLTALAGIAGVMVLAGASLGVGQICSTCVITYALVLAYGAICLPQAGKLRFAPVQRGAAMALGAILVAFLALLYPGLRTPAVAAKEDPTILELAEKSDATPLEKLLSRLSPQLRQGLSNSLAAYAKGDRVPLRPAHRLIGPSTAPVRITEFTDVLCGHCADLHETVTLLREKLPRGSFALEPRQFPLDSGCNPSVEFSSGRGVRCLAARALICVDEDAMAFSSALFENQLSLTTEKIYDLAAPFMSRERLEDCVAAPETDAKLRDDIAWAMEHEIQGTPLVLVNGRKASSAVTFLFAMVLAGADPEHPAFASLPPPRPWARLP
jgi:serine/threonine-protein kinase